MYHVLFAANDVRQMTLDQVDDCFRLGVITEETWLWTEGMKGWETLKDAAGLGDPNTDVTRKAPPPLRRGASQAPHASQAPQHAHAAAQASRKPPGGQGPKSGRRATSKEPPPRRSGRAVSTPEVVTSARPMQLSQPAPGRSVGPVPAAPVMPPAPAPRTATQPAAAYQSTYSAPAHSAPAHSAPAHGAPVQAAPVQAPAAYAAATQAAPAYGNASYGGSTYGAAAYAPTAAVVAAPSLRAAASNHSNAYAYAAESSGWGAPVAHGSAAVQMAPRAAYAAPTAWPAAVQAAPAASYSAPPASGVRHAATLGATYTQPGNSLAPVAFGAQTLVPPSYDDVPFARPRGAGFGAKLQTTLFSLCLVAGVAVVAYRNDYLFQVARSMHQESNYLALERRYLGGAPDGTPRDVKKLVDGMPAVQTVILGNTRSGEKPLGDSSATLASDGALPRVDSLATVAKAAEPVVPAPAPAAPASVPKPVEAKAAAASAGIGGAHAEGARSVSRPAPKAAEPKPESSRRSEEPVAKRTVSERPSKAEPKPEPEPMPAAGTDDFLHMSMRQAIKKKPKAEDSASSASSDSKPRTKKSSRGDYDPLNGEI